MNKGLGVVIWQIAVAAYLVAVGIMGFSSHGDLQAILGGFGNIFVIIASVIALIAGVGLILQLFGSQISVLSLFIFIIAVIWAVFIVILLVRWIGNGFGNFLGTLKELAVYTMVLASLLGASGKFG